MENKKDNPGVIIPPPLIYLSIYFAAVFIQKAVRIDNSLFHLFGIKYVGVALNLIALFFASGGLWRFFQSKNTVLTIKAASSLQTKGIYRITRNPMYVGMALVYLGTSCLIGNGWHFILFPVLIIIEQQYVIRHEEKYLERQFGQEYLDYKKKVRRWL